MDCGRQELQITCFICLTLNAHKNATVIFLNVKTVSTALFLSPCS